MRVPFRPREKQQYLEPPRSPIIPLSCVLAIAVACSIVRAELGGRLALITAAAAAVAILTRLPRILPVVAVGALLVAVFAVANAGDALPTVGAHVAHVALHHHGARR